MAGSPTYVPLTFTVPEHCVAEAYQIMAKLIQRGMKETTLRYPQGVCNVPVQANTMETQSVSTTQSRREHPNLRQVISDNCSCGKCFDMFSREHSTPWRYTGLKGNFAWNPRKGETIPLKLICKPVLQHFEGLRYDDKIGFIKHDVRGEELRLRAKQLKLMEEKFDKQKVSLDLANRKQVVDLETTLELRNDEKESRIKDGKKTVRVNPIKLPAPDMPVKTVDRKEPIELTSKSVCPETRYGKHWSRVSAILDKNNIIETIRNRNMLFGLKIESVRQLGNKTIIGYPINYVAKLHLLIVSYGDKAFKKVRDEIEDC